MSNAKRRSTQGVKYYAGDADVAKRKFKELCDEAYSSPVNVSRREQGLSPVVPLGYGMHTFPEVLLRAFLPDWRPNEEMEEVERLMNPDREVEYAPPPARESTLLRTKGEGEMEIDEE
eukprot:12439765-Alexandrium_andersonii.AAC.1